MGTTPRSELSNSIVEKAVNSLGKGFDLTSDFRLKYCKGKERLVLLNGGDERTLAVPGFAPIHGVSPDIKCDKGDRVRYQSDILTFTQMSEVFNRKVSMPGKIPSGLFNAMFGFRSGSWASDASDVKRLGLDGYFISLLNVHIDPYPLVLSDQVRHAVPSSWDPSALARFIEEYGTHIIVGLSVGGQDVVLVKQDKSSNLESSELKIHLDDLGDQIFSGTCNFAPLMGRAKEPKRKTPKAFNVFEHQPHTIGTHASMNTHDGVSVICSKRGGDPSVSSHCEWLQTVPLMPDVLHFSFVPVTSLLKGVPGDGLLAHAINLYLRYKPPIADLQYFLDFQTHKVWAPIYNDLPLGPATNRSTSSPAIHFNRMGPKLYVNTNQVVVEQRPVTGMRFYLEGMKCNKLAIHLQHPMTCPKMIENNISKESIWRGSEDIEEHDKYLEGINGKNFSHVCTVPLIDEPEWSFKKNEAFIVTGAQLVVKKRGSKSVLHLRLLFSRLKDCFVVQSCWTDIGSELSQRSGIFSAISMSLSATSTDSKSNNSKQLVKGKQPELILDSAVFPTGPPVSQSTQKLLRFVDTSQYCKGPQDNPGHWLVTGARLYLEKGRLGLNVNFSLLNVSS